MYIYKVTDPDSYHNYDEYDFIDGTGCPYKSNKVEEGKGYCEFCSASLTYYDDSSGVYSQIDDHYCTFPDIIKLQHLVSDSIEPIKIIKVMDNFCPIELFEGFGMNGPERRIEPDLVIKLYKGNIGYIKDYIKWNEEEYTKEEWKFIQASILTFELKRSK